MRAGVVAIVLFHAAGARADAPIVATAAVGVGAGYLRNSYSLMSPETSPGVGAMIDVGYRVDPHVALGVHLAMSRFQYDAVGSVAVPNRGVSFVPITLGLSAQLTFGRLWLVPAIGVEDSQLDNDEEKSYRSPAVGLATGVDILAEPGRRASVFIAGSASHYKRDDTQSPDDNQTFIAVCAGVAYRSW